MSCLMGKGGLMSCLMGKELIVLPHGEGVNVLPHGEGVNVLHHEGRGVNVMCSTC